MLGELLLPHRTISVIGTAKNTGKTTTLNYLIKYFHGKSIAIALTGIGRDGELVDEVTNTEKPRIFVYQGTVIATAEGLLPFCDVTKEILAVTDMHTPLGRVVVVRALSDGFVQVGGPSINAQLLELLQGLSGEKILVDGAINRKTQIYAADAVVLCTGAAFSRSMQETIEETRHFIEMLTLPRFESEGLTGERDGNEENDGSNGNNKNSGNNGNNGSDINIKYISGAFTDTVIDGLSEGATVVANDPGKIFVTPAAYKKLLVNKIKLAVKHPIRLIALTINPTSPYGAGYPPQEFLKKMREAVTVPVYNVCENNF